MVLITKMIEVKLQKREREREREIFATQKTSLNSKAQHKNKLKFGWMSWEMSVEGGQSKGLDPWHENGY